MGMMVSVKAWADGAARNGRPPRGTVREEALSVGRSLCAGGAPAPALHGSRGRSGRRYVVSVYPLAEACDAAHVDAVLIAVRRDADGARHVVGLRESGAFAPAGFDASWFGLMRGLGADELHVHLLATSPQDRAAALRDLRPA